MSKNTGRATTNQTSLAPNKKNLALERIFIPLDFDKRSLKIGLVWVEHFFKIRTDDDFTSTCCGHNPLIPDSLNFDCLCLFWFTKHIPNNLVIVL